MLLSLAQGIFLLVAGKLMFDMSWGEHPWWLLLVVFTTSLSAMGLALLVASVARSEAQVAIYGTLLVLVLAGISGCLMGDRDLMPENMQQISLITPQAWALLAYKQLLANTGAAECGAGRRRRALVLAGFGLGFICSGLVLLAAGHADVSGQAIYARNVAGESGSSGTPVMRRMPSRMRRAQAPKPWPAECSQDQPTRRYLHREHQRRTLMQNIAPGRQTAIATAGGSTSVKQAAPAEVTRAPANIVTARCADIVDRAACRQAPRIRRQVITSQPAAGSHHAATHRSPRPAAS